MSFQPSAGWVPQANGDIVLLGTGGAVLATITSAGVLQLEAAQKRLRFSGPHALGTTVGTGATVYFNPTSTVSNATESNATARALTARRWSNLRVRAVAGTDGDLTIRARVAGADVGPVMTFTANVAESTQEIAVDTDILVNGLIAFSATNAASGNATVRVSESDFE